MTGPAAGQLLGMALFLSGAALLASPSLRRRRRRLRKPHPSEVI